jgi:hypothetical protein
MSTKRRLNVVKLSHKSAAVVLIFGQALPHLTPVAQQPESSNGSNGSSGEWK